MATPSPYAEPDSHLAQGDIFGVRLVAPLADNEIRILRTESGLHGERAFAGEAARVFSYDDLTEAMLALPPEEQQVPCENQGGLPLEYVVVFGDLVEYFMVASQTCDVAGLDSEPKICAAVVPVISLASFLSRQRLPIGLEEADAQDETKWTTIMDWLQAKLGKDLNSLRNDPFALPDGIRALLKGWEPPKNSVERQIRGKIREFLNSAIDPKKNYIYYLPPSPSHRIPEAFVDFTRLYSVVTAKLGELQPHRVCSLASPYREEFAGKLGQYLSRIATPSPLVPPRT